MGLRASIITEFIYCKKCFDAVKKILCNPENKKIGFDMIQVAEYPIIAGYMRGDVNEPMEFEINFDYDLVKAVCHPVRICIFPEDDCATIRRIQPLKERIGDGTPNM